MSEITAATLKVITVILSLSSWERPLVCSSPSASLDVEAKLSRKNSAEYMYPRLKNTRKHTNHTLAEKVVMGRAGGCRIYKKRDHLERPRCGVTAETTGWLHIECVPKYSTDEKGPENKPAVRSSGWSWTSDRDTSPFFVEVCDATVSAARSKRPVRPILARACEGSWGPGVFVTAWPPPNGCTGQMSTSPRCFGGRQRHGYFCQHITSCR